MPCPPGRPCCKPHQAALGTGCIARAGALHRLAAWERLAVAALPCPILPSAGGLWGAGCTEQWQPAHSRVRCCHWLLAAGYSPARLTKASSPTGLPGAGVGLPRRGLNDLPACAHQK